MYVEFVHPPDSSEVILGVEMGAVPRVTDRVKIEGIEYRVYSIQWIHMKAVNKCQPIINLLVDEIEEHIKKKKKKK